MVSQVHPIPPYDNVTVFEQVLNRTLELGLYVIFDMRSCVVCLSVARPLFISLSHSFQDLPELDCGRSANRGIQITP